MVRSGRYPFRVTARFPVESRILSYLPRKSSTSASSARTSNCCAPFRNTCMSGSSVIISGFFSCRTVSFFIRRIPFCLAIERIRHLIQLFKTQLLAKTRVRQLLAYALLQASEPRSALSQFQAAQQLSKIPVVNQIAFGTGLAKSGDAEPTQAFFDDLVEKSENTSSDLLQIARRCA